MHYGIGIPSWINAWQEVQRAEAAGFTHAWFYDSQLIYSDVYAAMALAAHHTSTIKLGTLVDVGLGYIRLGQPATTLSGGEAQRVKLSSELAKRATGRTLYILDEPTTGLHFADTRRLIAVLQRLVDAGNTIVVIEHNLDVVKSADWIIDLGPEGGDGGGELVVAGTPEEVAADPTSYTGVFLGRVLGLESDDSKANGANLARPKQPAAVG